MGELTKEQHLRILYFLRLTRMVEERLANLAAQGKVIGGGSSINGQAMQRGFPEDFDAWAALGNDAWSYAKVLPYFRKSERDLDIRDEFHGTDGPMPVRRRQSGPWPAIQKALCRLCAGGVRHHRLRSAWHLIALSLL